MPAGKSKETYTHGRSKAATAAMGLRTADKFAAFFLPHLKKGMKVLDCGCGPGSITQGLAKAVAPGKAVGIDISEALIEVAGDEAARLGVKNLEFQVANAYDIPFPDASFDAVYSHTVLEHLKQPEKAIQEMLRVLKPGGLLGTRNGVLSSTISSPHSKFLARREECQLRTQKKNGGDADFGLVQSAMLMRAGLQGIITTTSTFEMRATDWQKILATPAKDIQQILRSHGVPEDEIQPMIAGIRRWARNPYAFGAAIMGETVGWKPKK